MPAWTLAWQPGRGWIVDIPAPRIGPHASRTITFSRAFEPEARLVHAAPELLAAVEAQHGAIDWLFGRLMSVDDSFRPSQSPAWRAVEQGFRAMQQARAEEPGGPADSTRLDHHLWAWPLTDIERFDVPVPARGARGFWLWQREAGHA